MQRFYFLTQLSMQVLVLAPVQDRTKKQKKQIYLLTYYAQQTEANERLRACQSTLKFNLYITQNVHL